MSIWYVNFIKLLELVCIILPFIAIIDLSSLPTVLVPKSHLSTSRSVILVSFQALPLSVTAGVLPGPKRWAITQELVAIKYFIPSKH